MTFNNPYAFLLLLLLPLLIWLRGRNKRSASLRFSSASLVAGSPRSLRQRLWFLPLVLRMLAAILLIIALARPQKGLEQVREINEGIAIEMVVDRSSSMEQEMLFEGKRTNRLEVVKGVFKQFVLGNGKTLQGRPNDLIGLITFAGYPETTCPLTLAHGALPRFLETVKLPTTREEDGTAIGDALALAAARLEKAEEVMEQRSGEEDASYELKSKIIILLTDGEQTAGKRTPLEGAKLAEEWGIKIYTIAVGGGQSRGLGGFLQNFRRGGVDTKTLSAIAEATGGKFFEAQDAKSLENIYREIDELERSEIQSIQFTDYKELFIPLALVALILLGLEILCHCTIFRRIP